jgi:hypothetical protein
MSCPCYWITLTYECGFFTTGLLRTSLLMPALFEHQTSWTVDWTWWTTDMATEVTWPESRRFISMGSFKKYVLPKPRSTDRGRTLQRIQNSLAGIWLTLVVFEGVRQSLIWLWSLWATAMSINYHYFCKVIIELICSYRIFPHVLQSALQEVRFGFVK